MANWGTITFGRMTLREADVVGSDIHASSGLRSLTITGEESNPPLTAAQVKQRQEDLMGMKDMLIPVIFTVKTDHNGYYLVEDVTSDLTNWNVDGVTNTGQKFSWSVRLTRIGPDNAVDLESRLTGTARVNNFGLSAEKWHAPSIGHYGYYTGTTQPSSMTRTSEDGAITVYRTVPADINPRWGSAVSTYMSGRVRVKLGGVERSGVNVATAASGWSLNNALVNVTPGTSGTLSVDAYDGSSYDAKEWNTSIGASASSPTTTWEAVTILRNDPEQCTIRLLDSQSPGRSILDLTLRRGSRFVEGYLQTDRSTTLGVWLQNAEAGTAPASGGHVVATSNDAQGHKFIVGSAKTFTANTVGGGLFKDSTTTMDFFIGAVVNGTSAASGDVATVLTSQYIGAMAENTMGVKR